MTEVFVGLGSNIEPEHHLRWALAELDARFGALNVSDAYRSEAYGFEGPDFLNMVVGFETPRDVDAVESVLSELENDCGRKADERAGSRALDLDLLLFGERVDARRRLPRTDILEYPFVLAPLAALAPALVHPVTGARIAAAWQDAEKRARGLERIGALGRS